MSRAICGSLRLTLGQTRFKRKDRRRCCKLADTRCDLCQATSGVPAGESFSPPLPFNALTPLLLFPHFTLLVSDTLVVVYGAIVADAVSSYIKIPLPATRPLRINKPN